MHSSGHMKKTKTHLRLTSEDSTTQSRLILMIRDAISREVADFLELVPKRQEALDVLMLAIDRGFEIHERRVAYDGFAWVPAAERQVA